MNEREPQILDVAEQQDAIERVLNAGRYNSLHGLYGDQWTAFCAGLKDVGITSLNLYPDQLTVFSEGSKDSGTKEIQKNARVLGYLRYDTNSRFSKLPVQLLVNIASGMGKDEHVIEKDEKAEKIVEQNFPNMNSGNEEYNSKKACEEFANYSATFKY